MVHTCFGGVECSWLALAHNSHMVRARFAHDEHWHTVPTYFAHGNVSKLGTKYVRTGQTGRHDGRQRSTQTDGRVDGRTDGRTETRVVEENRRARMGPRNYWEAGRGRGGSGTQNFVYQKWTNKIFPMLNFFFSRCGHFGLWGGGGVPPPPAVYGHSDTSPGGGGGIG